MELHPHNRWGGAKLLRERWQSHIDASMCRPVLILDEAQETQPCVLSELRLLCSARLDSHLLLTVVLAGDQRLLERFRCEEPPAAGKSHARATHARTGYPRRAAGDPAARPAEGRCRQTDDARGSSPPCAITHRVIRVRS